jgi:hypothetical protein
LSPGVEYLQSISTRGKAPVNLLDEKTSGLLLFDKVFFKNIKVKIEVLKNKSLSLACYIYLQLQVSTVDEQDLVTKAIQKKLFVIEKCQKFETKFEGKGSCLLQRTFKNSYTKYVERAYFPYSKRN